MDSIEFKTCTKCHIEKPVTEYHKSGKKKDGSPKLRPDCKACQNIYRSSYREQNPNCNRDYYEQNLEKERERSRNYYEQNLEKERERHRNYRENNPHKVRFWRQRRRARLAEAFDEDVQLSVLRERDGDNCYVCQEPIDFSLPYPDPMSYSLEHIIPLSKGGRHNYQNTALSHLVCNHRKGTSLPEVA